MSKLYNYVISTGGGVVLKEENMVELKRNGIIFCLTATAEEIYRRVQHQTHRPLLQTPDPLMKISSMLEERHPYYAKADYMVETTGRSFGEVMAYIKRVFTKSIRNRKMTKTLRVELGADSYPIVVGTGLLNRVGELLTPHIKSNKVLIVSDSFVKARYMPVVCQSLTDTGLNVSTIEIPTGEESKSLAQFSRIQDSLVAHQLDRGSVLIALGGGVIGDLGGFAAAVYMRGISYVQIPTTLQAQVDASVGGKTAINHPKGKNLIGAFTNPNWYSST